MSPPAMGITIRNERTYFMAEQSTRWACNRVCDKTRLSLVVRRRAKGLFRKVQFKKSAKVFWTNMPWLVVISNTDWSDVWQSWQIAQCRMHYSSAYDTVSFANCTTEHAYSHLMFQVTEKQCIRINV